MSLELLQDLRFRLLSPQLMAQRRLHDRLFEDGAVFERDGQGVRYRPHVGVMICFGELRVFDTGDVPSQFLNEGGRGGIGPVGVVGGVKAVEDEHGGYHVLYAVISIGEVIHGFVLLVDDADAGFVRAACD